MTSVAIGSCQFQARPRLLQHALDGEAILLDLETGRYYGLNQSGQAIWELITSGATPAQALDELEERFDAPRKVLESDLLALVAELQGRGLLLPILPPEPPPMLLAQEMRSP